MARIRTLKPEILEDEKTSALSSGAWRLFVSVIVLADNHGRLRANPQWLFGQVFWSAPGESLTKLKTYLEELTSVGLVSTYVVSGQPYMTITNWAKHQRIDTAGAPRCPGPEEATQNQVDASCGGLPQVAASCGGLPLDLRTEGPKDLSTKGPKDPDQSATNAADVCAVFDHYRTIHVRSHLHPNDTLKEWKAIKARLSEGYTVDDLKAAIDGMHLTPHNCGMNDRQQQFLGLELCMRNAGQVERFRETAQRNSNYGTSILTPKEQRNVLAAQQWLASKEEQFNAKCKSDRVREDDYGTVLDVRP